jgi:hypothetical protein
MVRLQRPDAVVEKIARLAHILVEQRFYLIHAALIHGNYFIDTSATVRCLIAGFCYFVLSCVAEHVAVSLQRFSQRMMQAVISPRQMMVLVKVLQVEIALLECVVSQVVRLLARGSQVPGWQAFFGPKFWPK